MRTMRRPWVVGLGVLSIATGIIAACVGEEPEPTVPIPDGGDGGSSSSGGSSGGSSGTPADGDTPVTDAGVDACATANTNIDPKNCGRCGHDCMHGLCNMGVCQPWVLITVGNTGILHGPGANATHVFYSNVGKVFRILPDGGSPEQMSDELDGHAFVAGPNGMLACGSVANDAGVYQLPSVPMGAVTKAHDVAPCTALAYDGTNVWAGRLTTLDEITPATTRSHSIAFFSERMTGGLALDATKVYWVNQNNGVWSAPKATPDAGRATLNTSGLNDPYGVAVSGQNAYVAAGPDGGGGGGVILQLTLDGGVASTIAVNIPKSGSQQHVIRAANGVLFFAAEKTLYGLVPPP